MKIRAIIVEDEKPAARLLSRKLEKLSIEVVQMLHSVEEAVSYFKANSAPDLLFLDIQLSDGLSFEIFSQVEISSAVIFTTAYDEYALKAFKLNSIDYLLKPIDEDDLEAAVSKFKKRFEKNDQPDFNLEQLKKLFAPTAVKAYKSRFTVKIGSQLRIIELKDIELIFSENRGTYIHTHENRDYLIDQTMDEVEQELDPNVFFRVSRKFIVPLAAVKEITAYSNSRLKIIPATYKADEVIVSREKVADFKKWLE
jgi:DNA-binding LytR/AlgR family response regulator